MAKSLGMHNLMILPHRLDRIVVNSAKTKPSIKIIRFEYTRESWSRLSKAKDSSKENNRYSAEMK